jgi:hypothetical protein
MNRREQHQTTICVWFHRGFLVYNTGSGPTKKVEQGILYPLDFYGL